MLTLGMAEEFRRYGVAVNSLWPRTLVATAAVEFEGGLPLPRWRRPAALGSWLMQAHRDSVNPREYSGQWLIDEEVLRAEGISDFEGLPVSARIGQDADDGSVYR